MHRSPLTSPGDRILIEAVEPELDGGRYPVKRVAGEVFTVQADIFRDGHDLIAAVLRPRREGEEPLESFADAVAAEEERLVPERARAFADERYNSWPIGCWSYLMRSRYAEQIEHWLTHFPREQFHFVTLDELSQEPQRALDDIHEFLGLPPHVYSELQPRHGAAYAALDPETRARLNDYFRPHNERLYELVGIDFGWERPPVSSASV